MTDAKTEETKKFFSAEEIVARAVSGEGGLIAWSIDACYPPERADQDHPRVGRLYAVYTLADGRWCTLHHAKPKAKALLALLNAGALAGSVLEWATAYDDPPRDEEELPFGVGPEGKQKLMAYRGRIWDSVPLSAADIPYEDGVDAEIEAFSCNDVGSCCYYEKKDGVFEMVIG